MIEKTMEVYIDDMLVKSSNVRDYMRQLEECFNIFRKNGMKLNPTKCTFKVSWKFFKVFGDAMGNRSWLKIDKGVQKIAIAKDPKRYSKTDKKISNFEQIHIKVN